MSFKLLESNDIKGFTINYPSDIYNPILLNRTLTIYDKNDSNTSNAIGLYDSISGTDIKIKSLDSSLYYNGDVIVSVNHLVSEINAAYTTNDPATYLTVSNICIFGNGVNNGYVNMTNIQGATGVGLRFNHSSNKLEVKDGTSVPNWIDLPSLVNSTNYLVDLQDVVISGPSNGQVVSYVQSSNTWVNSTPQLPPIFYMSSNSSIIEDLSGQGVLEVGNSATNRPTFIKIMNGSSVSGPVLTANSSPAQANIPINIKSVGTGDIVLDATSGGDIMMNASGTIYTSTVLNVGGTATASGIFLSVPGNPSNSLGLFASSSQVVNYNFTFPIAYPSSNGKVLISDTACNTSWTDLVGGSSGHLQYNNGGLPGGVSALSHINSSNVSLNTGCNLLIASNNSSYLTGDGAGNVSIFTASGSGLIVSNKIVTTPQSDIIINDASISAGTIQITSSVLYVSLTDVAHSGLTTTATISDSSPMNGQQLHIFFDNAGTNICRLDFGTNGLASGTGLARYLAFNVSGQSASMIYIHSVWRLINTGALVY